MSLRASEVFRAPRHVRRRKPEQVVQDSILSFLAGMGWRVVAVTDAGNAHVAGGYSSTRFPDGWPDITACRGGRFIGIEVKAGNGRQSDAQADMQKLIEGEGGMYILAYSVDDVLAALERKP